MMAPGRRWFWRRETYFDVGRFLRMVGKRGRNRALRVAIVDVDQPHGPICE